MIMVRWLKMVCPIYLNMLNVFKIFNTWWHHRSTHRFPHIRIQFVHCDWDWIVENLYCWWWWDKQYEWNFKNKLFLMIVDDVQYKNTFNIRQLESVPFILIKFFNWYFILRLEDPNQENDYQYWESMK